MAAYILALDFDLKNVFLGCNLGFSFSYFMIYFGAGVYGFIIVFEAKISLKMGSNYGFIPSNVSLFSNFDEYLAYTFDI